MIDYDVIVVGARVAGAPTAMLLATEGYRVLLVDRATFPSDTISTHLIHAPGMAALARWGLADRVVALGCPPVTTYRFDIGPIAIVGRPRGANGAPAAYAPRRLSLDSILIDAAARQGADVREAFSIEGLVIEDGVVRGIRGRSRAGTTVERARVVVGADGLHSVVATAVGASAYVDVPPLEALYYAYWSDLPIDAEFQLYSRDRRGIGMIPTEDGLTVAVAAWPIDEFEANRRDINGNYLKAFEAEPTLADRLGSATRETRVVGAAVPNYYRQSFGPGWALVGDAGHAKDPITAQGISDAFLDAESLSGALDDALAGRCSFDDALGDHQHARDERTMPMFQLTSQFAAYAPAPDETAQLFGAVAADRAASDDFASMLAGTMSVPEFFDPTNIERYVGTGAVPSAV